VEAHRANQLVRINPEGRRQFSEGPGAVLDKVPRHPVVFAAGRVFNRLAEGAGAVCDPPSPEPISPTATRGSNASVTMALAVARKTLDAYFLRIDQGLEVRLEVVYPAGRRPIAAYQRPSRPVSWVPWPLVGQANNAVLNRLLSSCMLARIIASLPIPGNRSRFPGRDNPRPPEARGQNSIIVERAFRICRHGEVCLDVDGNLRISAVIDIGPAATS